MITDRDLHAGRFVRHHILTAAGVPSAKGPIQKGRGRSNTAGKGHGKKGVVAGPHGTLAAQLYASVRDPTSKAGTGAFFEPTMTTIDYAGPAGFTSEAAKRITVQAGYDGNFLGIGFMNYTASDTSRAGIVGVHHYNPSNSLVAQSNASRLTSVSTSYDRMISAFLTRQMADGGRFQGEDYLTLTNTTFNTGSLAMLRPGELVGAIGKTGDQTSATEGTQINYDTYVAGYSNLVDTTNHGITINEDGWYLVEAQSRSSTSNARYGIVIYADATSIAEHKETFSAGNNGYSACNVVYLTAGQLVTSKVSASNSSTLLDFDQHLAVWRLRTADVLAVLGRGSNYSIPNSTTGNKTISLDSVIQGSGSLVTANSGKLTIQTTGWYLAVLSSRISRASTSECYINSRIYNETTAANLAGAVVGAEVGSGAGAAIAWSTMFPVYATAGDVLSNQIYTISGQPTVTLYSDVTTRLSLIALTAMS